MLSEVKTVKLTGEKQIIPNIILNYKMFFQINMIWIFLLHTLSTTRWIIVVHFQRRTCG